MESAKIDVNIKSFPVKLVLTQTGSKNLSLNEIKEELLLRDFPPKTVQKMMLKGYLSRVEHPITEITKNRRDLIDFTKIIIFGMFYLQFNSSLFDVLIDSKIISAWNRRNPRNPIDAKTRISAKILAPLLIKREKEIAGVRQDLLGSALKKIHTFPEGDEEDKQKLYLLSKRFIENIDPLSYYLMASHRNSPLYKPVITEFRDIITKYLEKSSLAEYFALMLLEVLSLLTVEQRKACEEGEDVRNHPIFLQWNIKKNNSRKNDRGKLHTIISNNKTEFKKIQQSIQPRAQISVHTKSLQDFYSNGLSEENQNIGLYYMAFLNEACNAMGMKFESFVNYEFGNSTLIHLILAF